MIIMLNLACILALDVLFAACSQEGMHMHMSVMCNMHREIMCVVVSYKLYFYTHFVW